jgi:hypothetical protein
MASAARFGAKFEQINWLGVILAPTLIYYKGFFGIGEIQIRSLPEVG